METVAPDRLELVMNTVLSVVGIACVILFGIGQTNYAILVMSAVAAFFLLVILRVRSEYIFYLLLVCIPFAETEMIAGLWMAAVTIIGIYALLNLKTQAVGFNKVYRTPDWIMLGCILISVGVGISIISAYSRGAINKDMMKQIIYLFIEMAVFTIIIGLIDDVGKFNLFTKIAQTPAVIYTIVVIIYMVASGDNIALRPKNLTIFAAELNANFLAMVIGPALMLMLGRLLDRTTDKSELSSIVMATIAIIALVITKSRGAWVGVLCGGLYIIIKSGRFKVLISLAIVMTILFVFLGDVIASRISKTNVGDLAVFGRLLLWAIALECAAQSPLVGFGPNGFVLQKFAHGYPPVLDPARAHSAHNMYLDVLVNYGALGLVGLLAIAVYVVYMLDRLQVDPRLKKSSLIGLNAAIITYLAHGMFDCGNASLALSFEILLLVGLAVAIIRDNSLVAADDARLVPQPANTTMRR